MILNQFWVLRLLELICTNIAKEESHLNPSIGVSHNTEMGERLAKDFLLANKWTDVSFDVEGDVQDLGILLLFVTNLISSSWNRKYQHLSLLSYFPVVVSEVAVSWYSVSCIISRESWVLFRLLLCNDFVYAWNLYSFVCILHVIYLIIIIVQTYLEVLNIYNMLVR